MLKSLILGNVYGTAGLIELGVGLFLVLTLPAGLAPSLIVGAGLVLAGLIHWGISCGTSPE
jgi:hypothetical protein